jgi:nitrogen fixation-related uncharacterized protein
MEAIIMMIVLIAGLVAVGAAALLWGADSRDPMPDDHRR